MTRRILAGAAALAFLAALPPAASARVSPEVRGGLYADADEAFVGGGLNAPLDEHWDFNPNLEWVLTDGFDYFTTNFDFHYNFDSGSGLATWVGGGPVLEFVDTPGGDDTDLGFNLLGGLGAARGAVRPFGQLKLTAAGSNEVSLAFGARF